MKLVPLSDAFVMIDNLAKEFRVDVESIRLEDAAWRILAENVNVDHDIPRSDKAAVDGVATRWDLISSASPHNPITLRINSNNLARPISMGESLPEGFDTVLRWEHVRAGDGEIIVSRQFERWMNVDRRGSYFREGDFAMRKGRILGPQDIALLSELGYTHVPVYRKIRATIISIGRELLREDKRAISNDYAYVIAGLLRSYGLEINGVGVVPDEPRDVEEAIMKSSRSSDLILTLGRASAGENDVIPQVIPKIENSVKIFHGISMYPGKPTGMVKIGEGRVWVILPGSILAAISATVVLVRRLIRRMLDVCGPEPSVSVILDDEITPKLGVSKIAYLRIIMEDGNLIGEPLPIGVDNLFTATYAQAYVLVEPGKYLKRGSKVLAKLLTGLSWPPHVWSSQYF